jgi:hypothetical protein
MSAWRVALLRSASVLLVGSSPAADAQSRYAPPCASGSWPLRQLLWRRLDDVLAGDLIYLNRASALSRTIASVLREGEACDTADPRRSAFAV